MGVPGVVLLIVLVIVAYVAFRARAGC